MIIILYKNINSLSYCCSVHSTQDVHIRVRVSPPSHILHQHIGGAATDCASAVLDQKVVVLQVLPRVGPSNVEAHALTLDVEPVDHEDRSHDLTVQCL